MIVLFTDYGMEGPYLGQVEAVLYQQAPAEKVINLFADVPQQNPRAGAYLLNACTRDFPAGTVFFCIVDPGVGSFEDGPVAINVDKRWFVGPDNGLFDLVAGTGDDIECWKITWRPQRLSSSFHGRDLYAPVCAMLANGAAPPGDRIKWQPVHAWPVDWPGIIYIDHFGNAMTGLRAATLTPDTVIEVRALQINNAETFADVKVGQVFWHENANGLVEIAVNQGRADTVLKIGIGDSVGVKACHI